jgi:hypothetical protein
MTITPMWLNSYDTRTTDGIVPQAESFFDFIRLRRTHIQTLRCAVNEFAFGELNGAESRSIHFFTF